MAQIQAVPVAALNMPAKPINEITDADINSRMMELKNMDQNNKYVFNTQFENYCLNIRNNIMLDKVLQNQTKIMQKLGVGENLDKQG